MTRSEIDACREWLDVAMVRLHPSAPTTTDERAWITGILVSTCRRLLDLVGAEPELLAACRRALEHHQGRTSEVGRALRTAIAKAEGEAVPTPEGST